MKPRVLGLVFGLSIVLNLVLPGVIASRPLQRGNANALGPFAVTNVSNSTNGKYYIVAYGDGIYSWVLDLDDNRVSVNVGIRQEATLRLTKETRRVKSTTIGLLDDAGVEQYYTDYN